MPLFLGWQCVYLSKRTKNRGGMSLPYCDIDCFFAAISLNFCQYPYQQGNLRQA
jgi:hypothetical protein